MTTRPPVPFHHGAAATTVRPTRPTPTSILMLPAPGTPGEHYFEGWRGSPTYPEERREWFIKNHNFFIE